MIKNSKKALSVLLSLIMIMSMFTGLELTSFAENDILNYLTYEINDGEVTITDCDSSISGDVVIPDTIEGYPVTTIGDFAFNNSYNLLNIKIPASVESMNYFSFSTTSCVIANITVADENKFYSSDEYGVLFNKDKTLLITYPIGNSRTEYTIPDSVERIGEYAFSFCNFDCIIISDSVKTISDNAFANCYFDNIIIPNSVTSIGAYAFEYCNLDSIEIPDSVTSIGQNAFRNCSNLTRIEIPDSVTFIDSSAFNDTAYYNNEENWTDGVLYIEKHLIQVKDDVTELEIREGTLTTANGAFHSSAELTNITIPASVTLIGDTAFGLCINLVNITVAESNEYYSSDEYGVLFNKNKTLLIQYPVGNSRTEYVIPDSVTKISEASFFYCANLTNVKIPNSVAMIGAGAFHECTGLTSIIIPEGVTTIGEAAFEWCTGIVNISIPASVTIIGDAAFNLCTNLVNIIVAESNEYYSSDEYGVLFNKDKTELIEYPEGSKITKYAIPDSVTSIEYFEFLNCTNLKNIKIPNSVTSIGEYALGYVVDFNTYEFGLVNGFTIFGVPGSVAETYATENNIRFKELTEYDNLENHEHSLYITENVDSTCTQEGYIVYSCSECNYQEISDTEPLGHDYSEKIIDKNHLVSEATTSKKAIYKYDCSRCNSIGDTTFEYGEKLNVYNLGEETYKFKNFGNHDKCRKSSGGHCFGMSITSASYYLKELDITKVGGKYPNVYGLSSNATTRKLICHYQFLQGEPANKAIVAGGSWYLGKGNKTESDWNAVVNYVKNHNYDYKGNLQLSFRTKSAGHAVNFLYYKNVNGQDRIYIYDNNCPSKETYLYKNTNGQICQHGYTSLSGKITCVALRNINKYLKNVKSYNTKIAYYAYADTIMIEGATAYYMDCGNEAQIVMYEIPEGQTTVKIIPLVNNATFTHMDKEYTFGNVDEHTYAEFTIPETDENEAEFEIFNTHEHYYTSTTTPATCIENGVITYSCTCGYSYEKTISAIGHVFNDGELKCSNCDYDKTKDCSCICHSENAIIKFINKIVFFFRKLFGMSEYRHCNCGVAHW